MRVVPSDDPTAVICGVVLNHSEAESSLNAQSVDLDIPCEACNI